MAVKVDGSGSAAEVERLKTISTAIAEGAMAFLNREYTFVSLFAVVFAGFMLLRLMILTRLI